MFCLLTKVSTSVVSLQYSSPTPPVTAARLPFFGEPSSALAAGHQAALMRRILNCLQENVVIYEAKQQATCLHPATASAVSRKSVCKVPSDAAGCIEQGEAPGGG